MTALGWFEKILVCVRLASRRCDWWVGEKSVLSRQGERHIYITLTEEVDLFDATVPIQQTK